MTLAPGIPDEIKRTASIKPLLERELNSAGYRIIEIPLSAQQCGQSSGSVIFSTIPTAPPGLEKVMAPIIY